MNSSLPPEKIKQIKQIIHDRYNEVDIQSQIRSIIAEQMSSNDGLKSSNQEAIVHEIRKKGIIDSLMSGVKFENHIQQTTSTPQQPSSPSTSTSAASASALRPSAALASPASTKASSST